MQKKQPYVRVLDNKLSTQGYAYTEKRNNPTNRFFREELDLVKWKNWRNSELIRHMREDMKSKGQKLN